MFLADFILILAFPTRGVSKLKRDGWIRTSNLTYRPCFSIKLRPDDMYLYIPMYNPV